MLQATKYYSREEIACRKLFEKTATLNESGRFVVSLPLKDSLHALGEPKPAAVKRFYNLVRKLAKDSALLDQYGVFMKDYDSRGHMRENGGSHCIRQFIFSGTKVQTTHLHVK